MEWETMEEYGEKGAVMEVQKKAKSVLQRIHEDTIGIIPILCPSLEKGRRTLPYREGRSTPW
jgi:hypothetical protein